MDENAPQKQVSDVIRTVLSRATSSPDGTVTLTEEEDAVLSAASQIFLAIPYLAAKADNYVLAGGTEGSAYVRDWILLADPANDVIRRVV